MLPFFFIPLNPAIATIITIIIITLKQEVWFIVIQILQQLLGYGKNIIILDRR